MLLYIFAAIGVLCTFTTASVLAAVAFVEVREKLGKLRMERQIRRFTRTRPATPMSIAAEDAAVARARELLSD